MATPGDKTGPLTAEELEIIWSASVDASYREPLVKAGDGGGMEVYRQEFAQFERVSLAVDRSFQALYILPFSGQSQPPASGPVQAEVTLTFSRSGYVDRTVILGAGLLWVDEAAIDSDEGGGAAVDTGRRYQLQETIVFFPGEQGPFDALAVAEKPGWGYNEPRPGTITLVEQVGSEFNNDLATVAVATGADRHTTLTARNIPDMFVPGHLGQYVILAAGANAQKVARMISFIAPDPTNDVGSGVGLEQLATVATSSLAGSLEIGEVVTFGGASTGAGVVVATRPVDANGLGRLAVAIASGGVQVGTTFTGAQSTATATTALVFSNGAFVAEAPSGVPETGGASWRVLDWGADLGIAATNAQSPDGGVLGMLDLLGSERRQPRSPGEADDDYRERISTIADVVSPNAIRRALNRSMGSFPWCFREVGSPLFPGFFFDRTDDNAGDYYDWGSLLFTGAYTSGSFDFQEPVEYRRGASVLAAGYWGSYLAPFPQSFPAGYVPANITKSVVQATLYTDFTLVLTRDKFRDPFPFVAWQSGDVIVGLRTGAVFTPSAALPDTSARDASWRVLVDYEEMRGCFIVGVPVLGFGEFGIAYDVGDHNAYDVSPFDDFYDGSPWQDASFYGRVWAALNTVRTGGVSWSLVRTNSPCS